VNSNPGAPAQEVSSDYERLMEVLRKDRLDRRRASRHPTSFPVLATELNDRLLPTDTVLELLVTDVSTSGIALVHHEAITAKYLAVDLPLCGGGKIRVAIEIRRCVPEGNVYLIGGRFVRRTSF
jgi:hypothetical protein